MDSMNHGQGFNPEALQRLDRINLDEINNPGIGERLTKWAGNKAVSLLYRL